MRSNLPSLLVALLLASTVAIASADVVYKVTAKDGTVSYTTNPPAAGQTGSVVRMDVPAPEATKSGKVGSSKAEASPTAPAAPTESDIGSIWNQTVNWTKRKFASAKASVAEAFTFGKPKTIAMGGPMGVANPILIYKGIGCADCDAARAYLRHNKIDHQAFEVTSEAGQKAWLPADRNLPLPILVARGKKFTGFSPGVYDEVLR